MPGLNYKRPNNWVRAKNNRGTLFFYVKNFAKKILINLDIRYRNSSNKKLPKPSASVSTAIKKLGIMSKK